MKLPLPGSGSCHRYAGEHIDVLRIRLWNASKASAVLSDFHGTERVPAKWAADGACSAVRFEVTFIDNHVLQGSHEFFRKGKRRYMFSTHLRRLMTRVADPDRLSPFPPTQDVSRYMSPVY